MVDFLKSKTLSLALVVVAIVEFLCLLRFSLQTKSPALSEAIVHRPARRTGVGLATPKPKPSADFSHITWNASICTDESMTWSVESIQVHVLAWRRPQSLFVLMELLRGANYKNWTQDVPLFVHVDGGADPLVELAARSAVWPHGPIRADIREEHHGAKDMWMSLITNAAKDAGPNTLLVVFEDNMRMSSTYFQYLLRLVREYGKNPRCRNRSLMGFSLSPVRLVEMRAGQRTERWRAKTAIPAKAPWPVYLSSVPGSRGSGAYWSDRWTEFADFVAVRSREPYYHAEADVNANGSDVGDPVDLSPSRLHVPGSSSNVWTGGWRRFLADFMYGCGLLMMYPNLDEESGFATPLMTGMADSRLKFPSKAMWQRSLFIAPLLNGDFADNINNLILPDFVNLHVSDLFMQPSNHAQVSQTGARFVSNIITDASLSDLGSAWCSKARMHELAL